MSLLLAITGGLAMAAEAAPGPLWWERGADNWYYKDDWKALALTGARSYIKTNSLPEEAVGGWIVVWGDSGYGLWVNEKEVGSCVDGGLIDDYDLSGALADGPKETTIRIGGSTVCAEGELVGRSGKRYPFLTGDDWQAEGGGKPGTKKMVAGESSGAYHRAHNGRLMTHSDEERGKTAIAKCIARMQKLNEQSIFLMHRLRPAAETVSFDANAPWRRAEQLCAAPLDRARRGINVKAIPDQRAGKFADAIAAADEVAILISAAEVPVAAATDLYRAEREITHVEHCAVMLGRELARFEELERLAASARRAFALGDWPSCQKATRAIEQQAGEIKKTIEADGKLVGGVGSPDEFPEDRFGWLNARELIGSDPANWPFTVSPASGSYIDLAGMWEFRTDPDNEGDKPGAQWRKLFAPKSWELQGVREENLKSPADCPYKLGDARCGDKPYNGFAWYRKSVFIPAEWQGKKLMLATGTISNWGRVSVNGKPLSEGMQNPPATRELPANLVQFGKDNVIAIQVYNHDNMGGVGSGPLAIYLEGSAPVSVDTLGPLSFVKECSYPMASGSVRYAMLASAMSPAVVVATDGPVLELWGWEAKGYAAPTLAEYVTGGGIGTATLGAEEAELDGSELAEPWVLLRSEEADTLVVLEQRPQSLAWQRTAAGGMAAAAVYESGPVRAAILVMPAGARFDEAACRFWAASLRHYPVAASELVQADPRLCSIKYSYLDLGGFGESKPLTVAPVPMLLSYGLEHKHPGVKIENSRPTGYRSAHAAYLVAEDADTVQYQAPAVDRTKVMKGVGELFGKRTAQANARGGLSEDAMYKRMAEWGFDHCRYAWAFHADWDTPLVKFMGGPILDNNDAMWKRLDEQVDKCNAAGMQMMLCWFFNEDSPQADAGGAVRNSTRYWRARPETKKNAFELWRRIAQRYADRPDWAISYDFFNEPAYMNGDHWNEITKELTAIIRSVDKKHLIVWESADGWAQPFWCLWMEPVKDHNVIYSFHHYGKHWGYAYDEYYPSYRNTTERSQIDPWLDAILFSIRHNVPIHCGELGISMIQPDGDGEAWLNDYLAMFERFGIGWNWWNYSGNDIYRTGLAAGDRISPNVTILRKWMERSGWGAARRAAVHEGR